MKLICGDCLDILRGMGDNSVDSIVTDPPYGLSFMGKKWDYDVPSQEIWQECFRVLKPGGHLLAFAGTRTQHRMAIRIEDAGFEIRDMIAWVYGSGFPKSLDISKAIDRAAGAKREVVGNKNIHSYRSKDDGHSRAKGLREDFEKVNQLTAPATPEAQKWAGWGTALKPAMEPITVARKPLEGTVVYNVLKYGTGGVHVDSCRVGDEVLKNQQKDLSPIHDGSYGSGAYLPSKNEFKEVQGRWPANLIHDGSNEVLDILTGARFFYSAKASRSEREEGLDGFEVKKIDEVRKEGNPGGDNPRNRGVHERKNHHPTVKPIDLMRYLCRLVTPPGGIVLDPFMGSGTTMIAAKMEGFDGVGIEISQEYFNIAEARIKHRQQTLFDGHNK